MCEVKRSWVNVLSGHLQGVSRKSHEENRVVGVRTKISIKTHPGYRAIVPYHVGFTLSQATKALRESRDITLLYFKPRH